MLRRVAAYAEKVFALSSKITDCAATAGYRPRAGSDTVFAAALMMCLCRMGSLNALEQTIKKTLGETCWFHSSLGGHLRKGVLTP
jgi:hypothetical protein